MCPLFLGKSTELPTVKRVRYCPPAYAMLTLQSGKRPEGNTRRHNHLKLFGAQGGTRTRTALRPGDFKSVEIRFTPHHLS